MRLLRRFPVFMVALTAMTIGLARPAAAQVGVLHSTMTGAQEVPGPGELTARGTTTIVLHPDTGRVCFTITASGYTPPLTAAHIHLGPAGVAGPVVIPLPLTGRGGGFGGCTTADKTLIRSIIANPSGYYTNVHSALFPAGVMRGQLMSLIPIFR